jgi:hypothetical protein
MILALPFTGPLMSAAAGLITAPQSQPLLDRVSALDPGALNVPDRALACAAREILQMGEGVEAMLRTVLPLYTTWDDATAEAIRRKEEERGQDPSGNKALPCKVAACRYRRDISRAAGWIWRRWRSVWKARAM